MDKEDLQPQETPSGRPEFKPEYCWAFIVMLLHHTGGEHSISLECLEKFKPEYCPDVVWDESKKSFTMRNQENTAPKILTAANVPKKILRKLRRTPPRIPS